MYCLDCVKTVEDLSCPQEKRLSPLLWSLVIDELLKEITDDRLSGSGHLMFIVRGDFIQQFVSQIQQTLYLVRKWCNKTELSVKPQKNTLGGLNRNILDYRLCWKEYQLGINHKNILANHKKQFKPSRRKIMIYPSILKPKLMYTALVWWDRTKYTTARIELENEVSQEQYNGHRLLHKEYLSTLKHYTAPTRVK